MACEKLEANSEKHGCDLHMLTFAVSAKPMEIINVYLATDKNEGLLFSLGFCLCVYKNQRFINNLSD